MRNWMAVVGLGLVLAACNTARPLPPEQNSLAKRLQPRPQRALVYFHGDPQRSRGAGLLLLVSVNPHSQASLTAAGPGVAKLKVFNDTFSLVDTPEGVLNAVLATEDGEVSDPVRREGNRLDLKIAPGKKYYVRVNDAPPGSDLPPNQQPFTVETVPEGEQAIAPARLAGFVRLNERAPAPPPPTAQRAASTTLSSQPSGQP